MHSASKMLEASGDHRLDDADMQWKAKYQNMKEDNLKLQGKIDILEQTVNNVDKLSKIDAEMINEDAES